MKPTALSRTSLLLGPKQLFLRHAVLSACFVPLYLLLCRPEVIFLTRLGFVAWYPATGLLLDGVQQGSFGIYSDISEQTRASQAERDHADSLKRLVAQLSAAKEPAETANRTKKRISGQHESRNPDSDERHHRHDRSHSLKQPGSFVKKSLRKI